jgi:hypothetical protein
MVMAAVVAAVVMMRRQMQTVDKFIDSNIKILSFQCILGYFGFIRGLLWVRCPLFRSLCIFREVSIVQISPKQHNHGRNGWYRKLFISMAES